jgi:peptidoglycan hydrolase-like protein with peptidoglycan-binding domain
MIPQTLQECFEIASDLEKVGCYRFAETLDHILESAIQQNRRTAARRYVNPQAIVGRFAQVMSDPFFVMGIRPDSTPEQMNQAMQKMYHYITQLENTNPARAKQLQEIWIKSLRRLSNPKSFVSEAKVWYPHMNVNPNQATTWADTMHQFNTKLNTQSALGDASNVAEKATNIAEKAVGKENAAKAMKAEQMAARSEGLLGKTIQTGGNGLLGKTPQELATIMQKTIQANPQIMESATIKAIQKVGSNPAFQKAMSAGGKGAGFVGRLAGPAAATFAVYEIWSKLQSHEQLDSNDAINAMIAAMGLVPALAPVAIAATVAQMIANNPDVQLAVKQLGINVSGVNMDQVNEDLINSGMTYNQQTGEWEDKGVARKINQQNHLSYQATLSNLVKQGIGVDAAWTQVFHQMKAAGATQDEILAVRQQYTRIKSDFAQEGKSGALTMRQMTPQQVQTMIQQMNQYVQQLATKGYNPQQIQSQVQDKLNQIPDLRAKVQVQQAIQQALNAAMQSTQKASEAHQQPSHIANAQQPQIGQLTYGMQGPQVAKWQQFLASKQLMESNQPPIFGPKTFNSTKQFQQMNGLIPDGIVGPLTLGVAKKQGFQD